MSNPEQESEPIRIALVDDQPLLRAGFAMLIGSQEDMSVVWQASDGDEVLDLARQAPVDIILMDVQMARVNGIAATEEVLPEFPETKVIMLTTFDDHNFVHGAISAGASGFLLKDVEPAARRVGTVGRRTRLRTPPRLHSQAPPPLRPRRPRNLPRARWIF